MQQTTAYPCPATWIAIPHVRDSGSGSEYSKSKPVATTYGLLYWDHVITDPIKVRMLEMRYDNEYVHGVQQQAHIWVAITCHY